jgi:hypothetical protein
VDDLYRFIHAWVPSLYGELDEDHWRGLGYILSDTDTDLSPELTPRDSAEAGDAGADDGKDGEGKAAEISELTRESWEVSSVLHLGPTSSGRSRSIATGQSLAPYLGFIAAPRNVTSSVFY